MSRVNQKALSDPPSQETLEGGLDSAPMPLLPIRSLPSRQTLVCSSLANR